ncbi:MAG: hypothetical protein JNK82_08065 [Myxococcaceae bacterium]|nr:hypothetical protein [Myxococcaceae bacterium]
MPALLAVMLVLAQSEQNVEQERPYWDKCKQIWVRSPYVVSVNTPIFVPGSVSGSSSGFGGSRSSGSSSGGSFSLGSGGGGGKPEALLVLAVVLIAAIPFIVYAVDSEADALTMEQFYCPDFSFSALGGAQLPIQGAGSAVGVGIAKFRADVGYVGVMAELGIMPSSNASVPALPFSAHFLVRPPPKAHIEGALALGARRAISSAGVVDGFELGLPHMYVFKRDGYRKLGLEVMPRVLIRRGGFDVGADLAMSIPVADVLQARVGAGVFSVLGQAQFTASVGLAVSL